MLWEMAPLSDQLVNAYCAPAPAGCGVEVAIVWLLPTVQLNVCGAVNALPSTLMARPLGAVVTVIATVPELYVMLVTSVAVLFAGFASLPPLTVTLLVTEDGALLATLTLTVMAG